MSAINKAAKKPVTVRPDIEEVTYSTAEELGTTHTYWSMHALTHEYSLIHHTHTHICTHTHTHTHTHTRTHTRTHTHVHTQTHTHTYTHNTHVHTTHTHVHTLFFSCISRCSHRTINTQHMDIGYRHCLKLSQYIIKITLCGENDPVLLTHWKCLFESWLMSECS